MDGSETDRIKPLVAAELGRWWARGERFAWDMGLQLLGDLGASRRGEKLVPTLVVQLWVETPTKRIAWFIHFDEPWVVDAQAVSMAVQEAFKGIAAERARLADVNARRN